MPKKPTPKMTAQPSADHMGVICGCEDPGCPNRFDVDSAADSCDDTGEVSSAVLVTVPRQDVIIGFNPACKCDKNMYENLQLEKYPPKAEADVAYVPGAPPPDPNDDFHCEHACSCEDKKKIPIKCDDE